MSKFRYIVSSIFLTQAIVINGISQEHPPALQSLTQSGVKIEKRFPVAEGITGYLIQVQGQYNIIYLTPDQKHVLVGNLLDEQGRSLTEAHLRQYMPEPDYSDYWDALEKTAWVAEGAKTPKNYVYVIADPYCPFCHAFWKASLPYQKIGLQLRWILVSYLRDDGEAKAAAIMEADDPDAAIKAHEQAYPTGGIAPLENPKRESVVAIRAHGELMREIGANGTPAVLYRDSENQVRMSVGMPKLAQLVDIFKLPEQAQTDPSLERFR